VCEGGACQLCISFSYLSFIEKPSNRHCVIVRYQSIDLMLNSQEIITMEHRHAKHSLLDDQVKGLIGAGYYPNKSELTIDALRYLFSRRRDLRVASAVELYQEGKVTLSRAAEIADMVSEEFKGVLAEQGLKIKVGSLSDEEFDEGLELIKDIRVDSKW